MSANVYDQGCRYLAKLEPPAFLCWLLGLRPDQMRWRGWVDARRVRFPGEPDRTCDTVAYLEDVAADHLPWAIPLEFQIEPDGPMFGRLLGYLGVLWMEERPSDNRGDRFCVGAVVVNLTGKGESSRAMSWPAAGLLTHLGVRERNLATVDARATLDGIVAGTVPSVVLALIPLMQGGSDAGIIADWVTRASVEPDPRRRSDLGGLALVFAEATGCPQPWKDALQGWNMIRSKQVEEWQEQARAETRTQALRVVLKARLGTLPEPLEVAIRQQADGQDLERWLTLAAFATTPEQFLHDISQPRNGA